MSGAAEDESKIQGTSATDNGDGNELSTFGQHNEPNKPAVSREENQGHGFTFASDKKFTAGSATQGPKKEDKQARDVARNFKIPPDEPGKPSAPDDENKEEHRVPSPSQKDSSLTRADEQTSASANYRRIRDNSDSNMPSAEDRISKVNSLVDQIANICGLIAPPMSSPRLSHPAGTPQNNDDNDRLSARYRLCRVDSLLDQIADISRPRNLALHLLLWPRPPHPSGTPQYSPKKPHQPSDRQPEYTELGRPLNLGSINGLYRLEKFLVSLRRYIGRQDKIPLSKALAEAKYFNFCRILRQLTVTTIPLDEDHDQDTVAHCELVELVDWAIFALDFATEMCQSLTEMHQKRGESSSSGIPDSRIPDSRISDFRIPDSKRSRRRQKAQAWLEEQNTQQTQPVDEVDQEHGAADKPDEDAETADDGSQSGAADDEIGGDDEASAEGDQGSATTMNPSRGRFPCEHCGARFCECPPSSKAVRAGIKRAEELVKTFKLVEKFFKSGGAGDDEGNPDGGGAGDDEGHPDGGGAVDEESDTDSGGAVDDESDTDSGGAVDDESDTDSGGAVDDESDADGTGEDGRSDIDPTPANEDLPVILTAAGEPDRLVFPVALVIYATRGLPEAECLTHVYKACAEMRRSFLTHLEEPPYPDDVPVARGMVGTILQSAEVKLKLACRALEEVLTKGPLPPQLDSEVEKGMPVFISHEPQYKVIKRFNIFGKKGIRSLD